MIKVNAGDLSKAMSFIWQAYKSKTPMEIMNNVKIDVADKVATLTYTNGEQELTHAIAADHKEPESFTVELKKFKDRVSQYDKESDVKIKFDSEKLKASVTCGRSKITLNGRPSDEYPSSNSSGEFKNITFEGAELKSALATVKSAQAINDVRYYLNGVLIQLSGKSCSVVATDGHRMHVCTLDVQTDVEQDCIIPASAIAPIHKFLDSGEVVVRVSANHLRISDEESSIQTNLIDGRFPDWKRVVPLQNTGELTFNTAELSSAIKGALVTSNEKFKGVKLLVGGGSATVESSSPDGTSSEDVIECATTGVDDIEFGVNGVYILGALDSIEESNVTLLVKDASSSMLIKEGGYMAVVMPMRL